MRQHYQPQIGIENPFILGELGTTEREGMQQNISMHPEEQVKLNQGLINPEYDPKLKPVKESFFHKVGSYLQRFRSWLDGESEKQIQRGREKESESLLKTLGQKRIFSPQIPEGGPFYLEPQRKLASEEQIQEVIEENQIWRSQRPLAFVTSLSLVLALSLGIGYNTIKNSIEKAEEEARLQRNSALLTGEEGFRRDEREALSMEERVICFIAEDLGSPIREKEQLEETSKYKICRWLVYRGGYVKKGPHPGVDLATPHTIYERMEIPNDTIQSVLEGIVIEAGYKYNKNGRRRDGGGKRVEIYHGETDLILEEGERICITSPQGVRSWIRVKENIVIPNCQATSFYAHLNEVYVEEGEKVEVAQAIGKMGHTGFTNPPGKKGKHLHFELRAIAPDGTIYHYNPDDFFEIVDKNNEGELTPSNNLIGAYIPKWKLEQKELQRQERQTSNPDPPIPKNNERQRRQEIYRRPLKRQIGYGVNTPLNPQQNYR